VLTLFKVSVSVFVVVPAEMLPLKMNESDELVPEF